MAERTNWAGNYTYRANRLREPATIDELRRIVARAPEIHALGTRHAFNGIADAAEQISLARIDSPIDIDHEAQTVTASAGIRYGDLAQALEREGLALHNMASLPHISVGGAIATATHGSGNTSGNLATAVTGLELVTSEGDVLSVSREDDDFAGMVVNLGALGVVTRVTLAVEPSYQVAQTVYERLGWDVVDDRFDEVMAGATSVSLFTNWGETVDQVWLKRRLGDDAGAASPADFAGAIAATTTHHPLGNQSAAGLTDQLGAPGPWLNRLPHFRLEFTPSNGEEIQSEYLLPRADAPAALRSIRQIAAQIRPHSLISEIRTIAADDFWLSTAYKQDSVGIHFTWKLDPAGVDSVLPEVEAALAPFGARPHWGKHFLMAGTDLADRYERLPDFESLASRLDPRGAFRNDFLAHHLRENR